MLKSWRIATGTSRTEDELMVFLQTFLASKAISFEDIKGVAISSVVPNVLAILQKMCQKYFHIKPVIVDHSLNLSIKILYKSPDSVGADRICNAVAASDKFKQAVICIDFGTATTFDVINGKGEYLGGVISPGLETTAWALHQRAAKLPKISLEFPPNAIGKSTDESIQSGIMLGTSKMVDGLIMEIKAELNEPVRVIATGGLAKLITQHSQLIEANYDQLVLDGLYKIYLLNKNTVE